MTEAADPNSVFPLGLVAHIFLFSVCSIEDNYMNNELTYMYSISLHLSDSV